MRGALAALLLLLGATGAFAGEERLDVSWIDNSGGTATTVLERRALPSEMFMLEATLAPGSPPEYADFDVLVGVTYCYRTYAYNPAGSSPYSNEACDTPEGAPKTLTVTTQGPGSVTSNPTGIACGADCTETYPYGTQVTLTAKSNANARFVGWFGACTGSQLTCTLSLTTGRTVAASFAKGKK